MMWHSVGVLPGVDFGVYYPGVSPRAMMLDAVGVPYVTPKG